MQITNPKTKTVVKNILFSGLVKGMSIIISFLSVPLVLSFLNSTKYGIWLTLSSLIGWFSLFDLGMGNGLRNHLTIAIANGQKDEAKKLVSTTYAALTTIFLVISLVFVLIHQFVNWTNIFNAEQFLESELGSAVLICISFLCLQFILRLITTILLSNQMAALADVVNTVIQLLIFIILLGLKSGGHDSLTDVSLVYSLVPVGIFFICSVVLFRGKYRYLAPSVSFVVPAYLRRVMSLGMKFFVIQMAALVLYASDNFIITQLFSPNEVTVYNVAYKYFSIINIAFGIILTPFWSMTTKAMVEGDVLWIQTIIRKLVRLWLLFVAFGILQLIASAWFYSIWTKGIVTVPLGLSLIMFFYSIFMAWGVIFANFLNGVGKVKLQLYISVAGMLLNIPIAIVFVKFLKLGLIGVPLAALLQISAACFINYVQYRKIIKNAATGIWSA